MPTIRSLVEGRTFSTVRSDQTVFEAVAIMVEHRVGALPVLDGDRLVGVFSERDLMARVIVTERDPRQVLVGDFMSRSLILAAPDDAQERCLEKMKAYGCRHLPVVDEDRLVGFLSIRDLVRADIEEKDLELNALSEYIHYVPPTREDR